MSLLPAVAWVGSVLLSVAQAGAAATHGDGSAIRPPYRPFIDPLEVHGWWWWMLVPMSFGIAVVYKAVRVMHIGAPWGKYWREVAAMTAQIIIGMALLVGASYGLVEVYVRWIAGQR